MKRTYLLIAVLSLLIVGRIAFGTVGQAHGSSLAAHTNMMTGGSPTNSTNAAAGLFAPIVNFFIPNGHDNQVRSDMAAIARALEAYYTQHGTYIIPGSGFGGEGQGWVAISTGTSTDAFYTASILDKLKGGGYLANTVNDDQTYSVQDEPTPRNYMLLICNFGQQAALAATLDHPTDAQKTRQQASCGSQLSTAFGKNYVLWGGHPITTTDSAGITTTRSVPDKPTCSIHVSSPGSVSNATSTTIISGSSVHLSWTLTNTLFGALLSTRTGIVYAANNDGSVDFIPNGSAFYSFIATGASGSVSCDTSIIIPPGPNVLLLQTAIANTAFVAFNLALYSPTTTAPIAGRAVIDFVAAYHSARDNDWQGVIDKFNSANDRYKFMSTLLPQPRQLTIPDPQASWQQNLLLCASAAHNETLAFKISFVQTEFALAFKDPDAAMAELQNASSSLIHRENYLRCMAQILVAHRYTLQVSTSTVASGTAVKAHWNNLLGATPSDWVGIVPAGANWSLGSRTGYNFAYATSNSKTQSHSTGSSGTITIPTFGIPAGNYQLVYLVGAQYAGGFAEKSRSETFAVTAHDATSTSATVAPTISAPTCTENLPNSATAGQTFSESWESNNADTSSLTIKRNGVRVSGPETTSLGGTSQMSEATSGSYEFDRTVKNAAGSATCSDTMYIKARQDANTKIQFI